MNYLNTKKLERKLKRIVKHEYVGDGHYVFIQNVNVCMIEGKSITLTINYGTSNFTKQVELFVGDEKISMDFLKGMFYQALFDNDNNYSEGDGNGSLV